MQIEDTPIWKTLEQLGEVSQSASISGLFETEKNRAKDFSLRMDGLYFDYSKTSISKHARQALLELAKTQDISGAIKAMFSGEPLNNTEERAVQHVALRAPRSAKHCVNGHNISDDIHDTLDNMARLCEAVHSGLWTGHNGQEIKTIVHIGIGGSDLGPSMICDALKNFAKKDISIHFVSNIDGAALNNVLNKINPDTTLFLIASKSFTTQETLKNAHTAKQWFLQTTSTTEAEISKHFVAMTVNKIAAIDFGIDIDNVLAFGDFVGGRFSLWSSVGLPIALYLGFDNFRSLLDGAHVMDEHFRTAPLHDNLAVILGLVGIWHRNFCHYDAVAILPYAQNLHYLPAYLQQIDMESNGKEVDRNGRKLPFATGPVIFGASGTNGQHAFYQHIHQSKTITPCEFIAIKAPPSKYDDHHSALLSHVVAQSRALMIGRDNQASQDAPEKNFSGNRPSTTLILNELTPSNLGRLLALYEHKIFVQGHIWGLNSFDQPGVELGKILAGEIAQDIDSICDGHKTNKSLDGSSQQILRYLFEE